jgi:hypothetical protein
MGDVLVWLGQAMMWIGFPLAVGAQIVAFIRIAKKDAAKAILALILPGYVLYYVWRSDDKMPGLLRVWVAGGVMFILGAVIVSLAMDL